MQKTKEFGPYETVTCPVCGSDELDFVDCGEQESDATCTKCRLQFRVETVNRAIYEEE